jgi:hypothetical protein
MEIAAYVRAGAMARAGWNSSVCFLEFRVGMAYSHGQMALYFFSLSLIVTLSC